MENLLTLEKEKIWKNIIEILMKLNVFLVHLQDYERLSEKYNHSKENG